MASSGNFSSSAVAGTGALAGTHRGVDLGPMRSPLLRRAQNAASTLTTHPFLPMTPLPARLAITSVPPDVVRYDDDDDDDGGDDE